MLARKPSRRDFLKIAGTMTGGVSLAACSPAATSVPTQVPAGPTATPAPVTLSSNDPYLGGPGFEPIAAEYRKLLDSNGNGWLQYAYQAADTTTLETRMAGGDAPDLIYVYPELAQPWAARKQLVSLTPGISADAA
jgi:ABC-type glycerol-3-phosphate transport system substrate-binding protein